MDNLTEVLLRKKKKVKTQVNIYCRETGQGDQLGGYSNNPFEK